MNEQLKLTSKTDRTLLHIIHIYLFYKYLYSCQYITYILSSLQTLFERDELFKWNRIHLSNALKIWIVESNSMSRKNLILHLYMNCEHN